MKRMLTIGMVWLGLCGAAQADAPTIGTVAPENSIVVMSVRNADQMMERFQQTGVWDLWQSDELRNMRRDIMEGLDPRGFEDMLRGLGVDPEQVGLPSGEIGFALFPVIDEELGVARPAMLAFADFGDKADGLAELIEAALERGERDGHVQSDIRDILGREVYAIEFIEDEPEFDEPQFDEFRMMPDPADFMELDRLYYLREGTTFMLFTDLGSVTEALDRIDAGEAALERREAFRGVDNHLNSPDASFMLFTRDIMPLVAGLDETGMLATIQPTLKALFGEIDGMGMGVRFDADAAMLESRFSVYMPRGKGGLTELMDVQSPREDMPRFVGRDVISYSSMHFQFNKLPEMIRNVVNSNPMLQMFVAEELDAIEPTMREIVDTLGNRVYMVSTLSRPITLESTGDIWVVECTAPQQFENLLAGFAPMMGMEPRDFLGQRIYTTDALMGGMMGGMGGMPAQSFSLGIGGGYVFAGDTPTVEAALRASAQDERQPGLADDDDFRRAIAMLPDRPFVGWGYTHLIDTMEVMLRSATLAEEHMREQMRREFPDIAEELEGEWDAEAMPWDDIDFDMFRRYIGPYVTYTESLEDGFISVGYILAPQDD